MKSGRESLILFLRWIGLCDKLFFFLGQPYAFAITKMDHGPMVRQNQASANEEMKYEPSGTIFGYDFVRESVAIRERIGYLPQQPRFIDTTIASGQQQPAEMMWLPIGFTALWCVLFILAAVYQFDKAEF